jgi:hypothetical protein
MVVDVELADDERELLMCGLGQWGGPANASDVVAHLLGLADAAAMYAELDRIRRLLGERAPLTHRDWRCALAATEIVWASEFHGAASDWVTCTGWDDARTVQVLRRVQRRLLTSLSVAYTREPY